MTPLFFIQMVAETGKLIVPDSVQKAQWTETIQKLTNIDIHEVLRGMIADGIWVILKILVALAIYLLGRWFIKRIQRLMEAGFERRGVDASLRTFLKNLVKIVFYIILILTVIQLMGINTTSFVALLASAGLAIGMALSGTLQNFAGGVMILMLRPYRVGDYIAAQGQSGTVTEIMLFSTKITTADKQVIYIPNSSISTAIIDNYSHSELRRVDITIGIAYGDDVDVARAVLITLSQADTRVLSDPKPVVYVVALADSSVNISLRVWVKNADYWDVFFALNETIYKVLPEKGIHFPFPQMDVHITKD
ncbi:MAG: mechanosensitive ion channel [Alistipes sp.]